MKKKLIIASVILCVVCMFAWIFLAVALTGGREIGEMTGQDKKIMVGFAAAEILTVLTLIALLIRLGRQNPGQKHRVTPADRARFGQNLLIFAASIALTCLMIIPGARLGGHWDRSAVWTLRILCYVLAVLLPVGNAICLRLYRKRYDGLDVEERQKFLLAHREQAEKTAAEKLHRLKKIRLATSLYALVPLLLGLLLAFCCGASASNGASLVPMLLIQIAFQQVPFPEPKAALEETRGLLPEQEYPRLYELARQAAKENGWMGEIQLAVIPTPGAYINSTRNMAVVGLSALSMGLMTEEELYALLLHEFAHVSAGNREEMRAADYMAFVARGRNHNFLSILNDLFYVFPDSVYAMNFELYRYAASLSKEQAADRAMARNPEAAAASLLKLAYYDLYRWEDEAADGEPEFESRQKQVVRYELGQFLQALALRQTDWETILRQELLARNATHPTTWARIQALGLHQLPPLSFDAAGDYAAEREKALDCMDSQINAYYDEAFEELHRTDYLEPKARVDAWEQAGCPVVAEEYADVVQALLCLRRRREAIALCDRAIAELTPIAAAFAYFTRGNYRLHRYNAAGIEDLYKAIELNNNAIDQALQSIGEFCCLTGRQQELDTYREKAVQLTQQQEDEFNQVSTLTRRDNLTAEHLPEGMLEGILQYISSISQDSIEEIYLVRKTISDTFFTSAFVIRFRPEAKEETRAEVLHRIFNYLDTCSDWQFSLFDSGEVPKGLVDRIPNTCVYRRNAQK